MPVRNIPKNYRNVTGRAAHAKASGGAAFESTLERDYYTLLEFDPLVEQFEVQPLRIEWQDISGKWHMYTPDVLIHYRSESGRSPMLVEVKYRSDLYENWPTLRPKFKAAIRECRSRGWRFKLMTEEEIRTPLLANARFLLPSLRHTENTLPHLLIASTLKTAGSCTVSALLANISQDPTEQAAILPDIWRMVATRQIGCNLSDALTMESRIWHLPG